MRLTILAVAVAVALGAAPRFSSAQSLAEIAAKEKERRKGSSGKVITESDLRSAGHGTESFDSDTASDGDAAAPAEGAPATEGSAEKKPAGPSEKTEDQKRADRQAALQKEIDAERAHIEGLKRDIATRETELSDPTFIAPEIVSGRRAALQKFVDDAKQAIVTHEAQVEKLLGQARSEGISIR
jgi:hypothetical protein